MRAPFFVTAAAGTADLLAAELGALGIDGAREVLGGVACEGDLAAAYRACLESRLALRVLWQVARFAIADAQALYDGVREIDWSAHMGPSDTLIVDFSGAVPGVTHTQFGAQRVKDAVVDQFRERTGERPSVDRESPTLRINAHAARGGLTIAIDLSGDSLHRRGYRGAQGAAPLKENLAAAILIRSGWPAIAAAGGSFVDPMCGSGTLPIEAALIAADIAPGLLRRRFGFERWKQHDPHAWAEVRGAAEARRQPEQLTPGRIRGFDRDPVSIRDAEANAARAGLDKLLFLQRCELSNLPAAPAPSGLVAVNPPYGERIGEADELRALYALLGERLRADYRGWEAAVFTGNPALGRELGINARRTHRMMNGPIECRLLRLAIEPAEFVHAREPGRPPVIDAEAARARPGAQMFANRLAKNSRPGFRLGKAREGFLLSRIRRRHARVRIRDRSLPVGSGRQCGPLALRAGVRAAGHGRQGPRTGASRGSDLGAARGDGAAAGGDLLAHAPAAEGQVAVRGDRRSRRARRRGGGRPQVPRELHGLPRHRPVPRPPQDARAHPPAREGQALPQSLLLHGRGDGACGRGRRGVDDEHRHVAHLRRMGEAELRDQRALRRTRLHTGGLPRLARGERGGPYDLIFLDPPTFSNSKRMDREFDVQRDHVDLIRATLKRLAPGGLLLFSTNFRKFKLDREALDGLDIRDITKGTIPFDFARDPKVHACFEIRRGSESLSPPRAGSAACAGCPAFARRDSPRSRRN